jgi:hypothetical protein
LNSLSALAGVPEKNKSKGCVLCAGIAARQKHQQYDLYGNLIFFSPRVSFTNFSQPMYSAGFF